MLVPLAILFLLIALGLSLRPQNDLDAALSREQTQAIKGIFVVTVFFSHFCSYVTLTQWFDKPLARYCTWLGQLMVVPFLFYSGYGIFESVREKGLSYVRSLPRKRILKTWLHFVMAVLLFVVYDAFFAPARLSVSRVLVSFFAWQGIGNSNWFIFAILCTYLFCFAGLTLFKGHRFPALCFTTLLCILYIVVVSRFKAMWWWDTILAFPLGCALSLWKEKATAVQKTLPWLLGGFLALAVLVAAKRYSIHAPFTCTQIAMAALMVLLVLASMRFALKGRILAWLGEQVFGIYILQRLPMEFGKHFHWNESNLYLYFLFCLISTLLLATAFSKTTRALDSKCFAA